MQGIHTGLTYKDLMDNYANKRDTRNNIEDEKETEETEEPEETEDVDDEEEVSETPLPDSWTEGGSNGEDPEPEITSEPNSGIISEPVDNGGNADSDAGAGDSEPSAEEEN